MKHCPQCQKTYSDDTSFCLDDGSTLFSSNFSSYDETPTVISQNLHPNHQSPVSQTAKWVYPVVGVMSGLIIILGFLAVLPYLTDKKESSAETTNTKELNKNEKVTTSENVAVPSPSIQTIIVEKEVPKAVDTFSYGRFPQGSTRLLTNADLYGKSSWDLRIMRNEIFARHGYIFKKPELRQYFSSQTWYTPRYTDVSRFLSSVEKQNAQFLKKHE